MESLLRETDHLSVQREKEPSAAPGKRAGWAGGVGGCALQKENQSREPPCFV